MERTFTDGNGQTVRVRAEIDHAKLEEAIRGLAIRARGTKGRTARALEGALTVTVIEDTANKDGR